MPPRLILIGSVLLTVSSGRLLWGEVPLSATVEGQPLGANITRLVEALEFLGYPLPKEKSAELLEAARRRDATQLQELLDAHVLFIVQINPELRVKVSRGPAPADLRQSGFTPFVFKVVNQAAASRRLRIFSPQAGPVYGGAAEGSLARQQQTELNENENAGSDPGRFLEIELFGSPPMTSHLSGLEVEYAITLIHAAEAGKREATIGLDVGQGTQDLGFRGEVPILFDIKPAVPVRLSIRDHDGKPTVARLTFRDSRRRIHPPQAKRLAPDFFFQPQIYRAHGDIVLLPPGQFDVAYCRGPEYRELTKQFRVPDRGPAHLEIELQRWIDPAQFGFYCGDHHIHGAGCSHYQIPTQGVKPQDMFLQVKGEGLNVGCVLTWGPCFEYQRQFFAPRADAVSEPLTILKYDLEISGFGSAALGHVCLLNLKDQTYPGSEGTKSKGWPTWTVPVLRWAKAQGGVTGYPHSDMLVDASSYAQRFMSRQDTNGDQRLSREEAESGLLPDAFDHIDADGDGFVTVREMAASAERKADQLPNLVLPSMRGSGAMEIFVSAVEGVCDFISAMDTGRIGEWNTWYHLMNCGFPLKLSGETDFPCMSSRRVGQGRVYVKLADEPISDINFSQWCQALAQGRSYVSDGYAHALEFTVDGTAPGAGDVELPDSGTVAVRAKVSFSPEVPVGVAYGTLAGSAPRNVGDTRVLHGEPSDQKMVGGERLVEIVTNGRVMASSLVPADGQVHDLEFTIKIDRSSWIALRQFPQLHTNPVNVLIGGKPIRAWRESALWCAQSVELLWDNRSQHIAEEERPAARTAYERAIDVFRKRAGEAP